MLLGGTMTARTKSISKTRQERMPFDAYSTPLPVARAICQWLIGRGIGWQGIRILEPSAGHGAFVKAARETWPQAYIVANEIQPKLVEPEAMRAYLLGCAKAKKEERELPPAPEATLSTREILKAAGANDVWISDVLTPGPMGDPFDLIVMNPPYSQGGGAAAHTAKAIELLKPGGVVASLMKMHFRGTEARIQFWEKYAGFFAADPPIVPRPDFTGDGRDTVEYTLFCFHRPIEAAHWKIHCAPAIVWRNGK